MNIQPQEFTINEIHMTFENISFLSSKKPYACSKNQIYFDYVYPCSLSQEEEFYELCITRNKITQYNSINIGCSAINNGTFSRIIDRGDPSDDKLVEIFTLAKGKIFTFSFRTEYGVHQKKTREANFTINLAS
jgi:hypothetical protein